MKPLVMISQSLAVALTLTALGLGPAPLNAQQNPSPADARCFDQVEEAIYSTIASHLDSQTDFPGQVDACEPSDRGCTLTPTQNAWAKSALEDLLNWLFEGRGIGCE